ncbi:probable cytochrome P450 305a1 [Fopius arisanus]|uniref:Cyp305a1_0 protein n=3 Tax=Fopius arisanus TaxID=64838 RepID=A0A0C9RM56_9HYME|nr:PREDICTED: probable cytochrome P450 305a1 [Fopius arisanus]
MFIYTIYLIVLCLILTVIKLRPKLLEPTSGGNIPGPFPWPVLGNLRLVRRLCKKFGGQHKAFLELSKDYNSNIINLRLGHSDVVVVCGYKGVAKILRDETFDARPWNEFTKIRNMGLRKGITMNEGPVWREMRSWLVRCLRDLGFGRVEMSDKIRDELVIILQQLKAKGGGILRMNPIVAPAVINVIWSVATGKRIEDEKRLRYFLDLMERRAKAFDIAGGMLSVFPWIRHVAPKSSGYELLMTVNEELKLFLMETINEHKKTYTPGKEMDLIHMFLAEMYNGKGPEAGFTEDQLLMILIDLFIAGSQTTTVTLDFMFLYMTLHQDVQEKVHQELDSVISFGRLPQQTDRPLLPYTESVMTESQRLRVVTPIIGPRRALNDTTLEGYKISKGTCILMNIYSIHTNPEDFDDPEVFKPERFMVNGAHVPHKKLIFFGGGHRRCPGETLARSAVFLLFTGIMRNYKLLPVPGKELDAEPQPGLTISPKPYEVLLVSHST